MRKIFQSIGCILVLYDEATGKTINRNVCRISDTHGRDFIFKGNGVYVLLGEVHAETQIIIESNNYQRKEIIISGDSTKPNHIWLMPDEKMFAGTCLTIKHKPYKTIDIILEQSSLPYRLMSNVNKGDKYIKLYHMDYDIVAGKMFKLTVENKSEYIHITGRISDNLYELEENIKHLYSSDKTKILPVIRIETDVNGEGKAILKDIGETGSQCIIQSGDIQQTVFIEYKQNTHIGMENSSKNRAVLRT